MNQYELAAQLGVNQGTVSRIFKYGTKSHDMCKRLASATGLPWKDFLDMPGAEIRQHLEAALARRREQLERQQAVSAGQGAQTEAA